MNNHLKNSYSKKMLNIGIALGSGSARGLAHIGVIRALEETGIKIDYFQKSYQEKWTANVGQC